MATPFDGLINVDIRDSVPDWARFEPAKAPEGAPSVVYIVLDDVGYSAIGCYGGPVETPNIDRMAANGLRYTKWHTTALCSPTRSCLLTGRTNPQQHGAYHRGRNRVPERERHDPAQERGAPAAHQPRNRYRYFPDVAGVPEAQAVNLRNRDHIAGVVVDIPGPGASGLLVAQGSDLGGHTLHVKDNRLHYVYNFVGMFEQHVASSVDLPAGEKPIVSAAYSKEGEDPPGVANGVLSLYHGEQKVGEGRIKTQPGQFGIAGTDLTIGRGMSRVTDHYPGERPWRFTGGTIHMAAIDVSGEPYVDLERETAAMIARE